MQAYLSTWADFRGQVSNRIVRHARQVIFQLAEVAVSREEFAIILELVNQLRPVPV